ncbi:MAG TPA: glycosyltransferase family 4 protein [Acidimicrobiia bacterium]|nr:glycosyltransferase family 4 protein [Acidimicrobiia bacterium]
MNLYWYWPFLRREELVLAPTVVGSGDHLVVHTTPRCSDPITSPIAECEIRPTLPAVGDHNEGSTAWMISRAATYLKRARARHRVVAREQFDVAHVIYLNPFTDALSLAALARRVPLVCTVHDVVPHQPRVPKPVEDRLLTMQYRRAGTIVTHHAAVRRELIARFPVDPTRVVVIPLPVAAVDDPLTPRHAPPSGPPTVLFFGAFRRNKGIDVLLEAIAALGPDVPARFVFAGRGFADVERLVVDAARVDPRIEVELGYATAARKHELHRDADLMVLPYTSFASQSAVLQDAYAHRLPLVVTDVGALGETVRDDDTGWVVPPDDVDALGAALLSALADSGARTHAAEAADVAARARTPSIVGAQLRALYESVARSP